MKRKKAFLVKLEIIKFAVVIFALGALISLVGLIESIGSGDLLSPILYFLIFAGAIGIIALISKTRSFKVIRRLGGADSLGDKMY